MSFGVASDAAGQTLGTPVHDGAAALLPGRHVQMRSPEGLPGRHLGSAHCTGRGWQPSGLCILRSGLNNFAFVGGPASVEVDEGG